MTRRTEGSAFSVTYRVCWVFIVLVGMVWGVLVGVSLASGGPFGPATGLLGILGTGVLSATLFIAGSTEEKRR